MAIQLICLDADDTLWHTERHFHAAHAEIMALVADFPGSERRLETSMQENISIYGFGPKSYILSVLETVATLMTPKVESHIVLRIIALGKELLAHPVELLDGIPDSMDELQKRAPLVLVTKGDLFHQEAKLAASGIGDRFLDVAIVSDKNPQTFLALFKRHGIQASEAMVIGDSMRSDILPALEAGAYAAYVPHDLAWSFETKGEPADSPRFRRVRHMSEIPLWIDAIAHKEPQPF
ncbi:MAG: HAD family hydrolase [Phyllobacterium sp.]